MEYIAHRGKTQEALDNTIEAFEHAGQDAHFIGIECDIHSTLDGVLSCITMILYIQKIVMIAKSQK